VAVGQQKLVPLRLFPVVMEREKEKEKGKSKTGGMG
jgi:hypothetical protein